MDFEISGKLFHVDYVVILWSKNGCGQIIVRERAPITYVLNIPHECSFMGVFHLQVCHVSATQAFIHGSLPLAGLPRICITSFHSWGVFHLQVCHVSATQAFIRGGAMYLQHKLSFMGVFHLQVCHVSAT